MRFRQFIGFGVAFSAAVLLPGWCPAQAATLTAADRTIPIAVPAQPIETALNEFARQSGVHVVIDSGVAGEIVSNAVEGQLRTEEALALLLKRTGLTYRVLDAETVAVERPGKRASSENVADGNMRLAQADGVRPAEGVPTPSATTNPASESTSADSGTALEEVIVTATKRPESVRKISGAVTAMTGSELEQLGAQSMADYLTRIPGVVFNGNTPGNSTVTIRGISTTTRIDQGQGTTGYFIDDIPLTDPFFALAIPDIDTFDVDNVTVLRGPQGTLFGSASLGGAVNYQTAKPDPSRWGMHVQVTGAGVEKGGTDEAGKIMLNVPLIEDKLAVRAVYVYRDDAGFIDNIGTGRRNANRSLSRGGRFQALWAPLEHTRVSYLFLNQSTRNRDDGVQMPLDVGPLQRTSVVPEASRFETLLHNLRLDQDLGFGTFTATASYHEKIAESVDDLTADLAPLIGAVFGFDASQVTSPAPGSSRGKTFEIRLASPTGRRFEYLIGAMRDQTRMKEYQSVLVPGISPFVDAIFGPGASDLLTPGDSILDSFIPVKGTETAAFGEGTLHFNDRWKATLGGRAFHTKVDNSSIASGLFVFAQTGEVSSIESGSQTESGFTPKLSVTWSPNEDVMAYVLAAKGFRYGGPNIIPSEPGFAVPRTFDSDSLWNYEVGVRSSFLDRRVQLDGTVFYIDWSDIQLRQQTPSQLNYAVNAGKARSRGVEGAATWLVMPGLRFAVNATYLDAELTEDFISNPGQGIPVIVTAGTPLPGASKWQVSDTLSYKWTVGSLEPSLLFAHRFLSKATSGVIGQDVSQGDYHLFDARASIQLKRIGITAFVANIGDKRGVATASSGPPLQQFLVRPRTVGITLDYRL